MNGEWHQLVNGTQEPLKVIEIQYGENCIEEDIERQYRNKEITGGDIVSNIHFFQKVEGFSTTEIINEIGS